jgi:hypothetical protein
LFVFQGFQYSGKERVCRHKSLPIEPGLAMGIEVFKGIVDTYGIGLSPRWLGPIPL